jgi:hypothetical protein
LPLGLFLRARTRLVLLRLRRGLRLRLARPGARRLLSRLRLRRGLRRLLCRLL